MPHGPESDLANTWPQKFEGVSLSEVAAEGVIYRAAHEPTPLILHMELSIH
jgi:hypothetical protein